MNVVRKMFVMIFAVAFAMMYPASAYASDLPKTEHPKVSFQDSYYGEIAESDRAVLDLIAASPKYENNSVVFTASAFASASKIPVYEENGKACVEQEDVTKYFLGFYKRNGFELVKQMGSYNDISVPSPMSKRIASFSVVLNDDYLLMGSGVIEDFAKKMIDQAGITADTDQFVAANRLNNAVKDYLDYDLAVTDSSIPDAIESHKGVCRHYSKMFEYACKMCGITCETVYGYMDGDINQGHAWNRLTIGGTVYCFDVTSNDAGPNTQMFWSEEGFAKTHTLHSYYD